MPQLNNSTNSYSASNYQVSTIVGNGNFLSIQAAINAAVSAGASSSTPFDIWIQAGNYTENLTLAPYVNLSGSADPSAGSGVTITGNAIYPDPSSGNFSLTNIGFTTPNSSAALSFQSTGSSTVHMQSVSIDAASGIGLECTGSGMIVQVTTGSIVAATGGICKNISDGFVEFFTGLVNYTDTASTISGGTLRITAGDISDSFAVTGGIIEIFSTIIQSGALSCVNLGPATTGLLSDCSLGTGATYIVSGTGTLVYTNLLALQSGTPIDPGITQSPLPTIVGNLSFDGGTNDITFAGPYTFVGTLTGNTAVTFPTSGTLATTSQIPSLPLSLANGGTNANLTASNGGIFYSTASAGAILSGTATAHQVLLSGSSTTPAWSTATYPTTTTANQLLYSSATNTIGGITVGANGVLISSNADVPSWLANGTAGQVLTANTGAPPSWQTAASSITLDGNSGSATGSTITLTTGASNAQGTALFTGSSSTMTFTFSDPNWNIGIGEGSLISIGGQTGTNNIAIGGNLGNTSYNPLGLATSTANNIAIGARTLASITSSGGSNIAIGYDSMDNFTGTGFSNIGIGLFTLNDLLTGSYNVAIGQSARTAYQSTEYNNILIGYNCYGLVGDTNTTRIGFQDASPTQTACFIDGIYGQTTSGLGTAVLIDSTGNLGTISSSKRYKDHIRDLGSTDYLYDLRPVSFVFKKDPEKKQIGLIAEEVLEVAPHLVGLDNQGQPDFVAYHDLIPLLLNEIQKLNKRIEKLEGK